MAEVLARFPVDDDLAFGLRSEVESPERNLLGRSPGRQDEADEGGKS